MLIKWQARIDNNVTKRSRAGVGENHDFIAQKIEADRFAFTLSSEDITRGKPDPEIYQTAASRFNLPPERMMALEDSETGTRSAAASGAFTVAVPGDHSRHHNFDAATIVVDDLNDLRIYEALGIVRRS